jgi:hypothetical protein
MMHAPTFIGNQRRKYETPPKPSTPTSPQSRKKKMLTGFSDA